MRLRQRALPERDLASVSLQTRLLDRSLQAPLFLFGTDAELAAARHGLALVMEGDREPPDRPPLLLASLSGAQARGRDNRSTAAEAVERLDADGLSIHLNPLREPDASGVLEGIATVVAHLAPLPVVVTAVGFGMDFEDVALLREAGVAAIDVGGGVEALTDARAAAPGLPLIAGGGLSDGADVAKCIALGASAAGIAPAGADAVGAVIEQLRVATWLAGAGHVQELGREHLR